MCQECVGTDVNGSASGIDPSTNGLSRRGSLERGDLRKLELRGR